MDDSANLDLNRLNLQRVAQRPALASAIGEYCVHVAADPKKALELGAECTRVAGFKDWWWKLVVGRAYHKLGLFREAEKQFKSSLREQDMVVTHLELVKVLLRLDQPTTALQHLAEASASHPGEPRLVLGSARIHDMLGNSEEAAVCYRRVLALDASNVESIACLAAIFFYSDQPEMALRYYRRLLQMGVASTELWNNLGLCCFHSSQYDMALNLFERALEHADESNSGDVWYNIGHVAIGIGDVSLAYQALKVATSIDPSHAESLNNLAVLELRKQSGTAAIADLRRSQRLGPHLFEPLFNSALLAHKAGNIAEALDFVNQALAVFPGHKDSLELLEELTASLS
jgi:tetratricopeptide repeat protein 8